MHNLTMKTLRILAFLLICGGAAFAQVKPDCTAPRSDQPSAKNIERQVKTFFLQFRERESGKVVEVEQRVLEARFQEMIDEIDLQFHTPPALRDSIRNTRGHSAISLPNEQTRAALR